MMNTRFNAVPILFCFVSGANILTMSIMNFFELETKNIVLVYTLSGLFVAFIFEISKLRFPSLTKREHAFCLAMGLLVFFPRLGYLIEDVLGYAVNAVSHDDAYHLQRMSGIVHTERFPPRLLFPSSGFLSYYYAPYITGAALYWTGSLTTVKQALGLTMFIYGTFFFYGAMYASKMLFREDRLQRAFLILCLFYGGFDFIYWLFNFTFIPSHSEWWALDFGFDLQYSNFFTLTLWVPQHFIAAALIGCGLFILVSSRRASAQILCGLLLLSAFFSSVFVFMGAIPLLCWFFWRYRLLRVAPILLLTFGLVSLPLWWIYLGQSSSDGFGLFEELSEFWTNHKFAAFLVFLLVLSLELLAIISAAFIYCKSRNTHFWLLIGSVSFLLSTYFISYSPLLGNNYAMRGSIVPIFTLIYLAAPVALSWWQNPPYRWLRIAMACYLLGGCLEYVAFFRNSLVNYSTSNTRFNIEALYFNEGRGKADATNLVREASNYTYGWFLLERMKPPRPTMLQYPDFDTISLDSPRRLTASSLLEFFNVETVAQFPQANAGVDYKSR